MSGAKIIDGLKEAIAGDLHRVTIDGQVWVHATDLLADQQEIMRINNLMRDLLNEALVTPSAGFPDWARRVREAVKP